MSLGNIYFSPWQFVTNTINWILWFKLIILEYYGVNQACTLQNMGTREGKKPKLLYTHTNIFIRKKEEIVMKVTFVSVTANIVVAGIYNCILPLFISYSLCPWQGTQPTLGLYLTGQPNPSFLSALLVVLPGLRWYSFPLTWLTGHDNIRDNLKALLYSTYTLPYLHRQVVVQFPFRTQDQSPQSAQQFPSVLIESKTRGTQSGWAVV